MHALALIWVGNPDAALSLLEYRHFDTARRLERGQRAVAQALALRALGRIAESELRMAKARVLKTEQVEIVESVLSDTQHLERRIA